MAGMIQSNPVLIIIDVQKGFEQDAWGTRNNVHAEDNMLTLLPVSYTHLTLPTTSRV